MIFSSPIFKDSKWRRVIVQTFFGDYLVWIVMFVAIYDMEGA